MPTVDLEVNTFDHSGAVNGTAQVNLTGDQLSDVVSHALQAAVMRRAGLSPESVMAELDDALVAAGLLRADYSFLSIPAR